MGAEQILQIVTIACSAVACVSLAIFSLIKFFRRLKRAKTFGEAKEAVNEFIEEVKDIANDENFQNVKDFTVNLVVNVIEKGNYYDMRGILGCIKEKCSQENIEYNESYWCNYIKNIIKEKAEE